MVPTPPVILTASHELNLVLAVLGITSAVFTGLSRYSEAVKRVGMWDVGVIAHGARRSVGLQCSHEPRARKWGTFSPRPPCRVMRHSVATIRRYAVCPERRVRVR